MQTAPSAFEMASSETESDGCAHAQSAQLRCGCSLQFSGGAQYVALLGMYHQ